MELHPEVYVFENNTIHVQTDEFVGHTLERDEEVNKPSHSVIATICGKSLYSYYPLLICLLTGYCLKGVYIKKG